MIKKSRLVILIALLVLVACVMTACKDNQMPEKMAFDAVLEKTNTQPEKKIESTMSASFICYNASGVPGKLTERIDLTRITSDDVYYMYGELRTEELTNIMEGIVNLIVLYADMADDGDINMLLDYLKGKTYIAGRSGLKDDTLNGQVVLCEEDTEPIFDFAEDGSDILALEKAWGAIKYSDFLKFKESLEVDSLTEADFLEMLYSAFSLPVDWETAVDAAKASFVKIGKELLAEYDFTYESKDMVEFIKEAIERYMEEIWKDDEETYEILKDYYDRYVDFAFEIFTVSDLRTVATVDSQNRLVSMNADMGVKLTITDDQIIEILKNEEVSEKDIKDIKNLLNVLHIFFGCSTKEKGKFEFEVKLSLIDTYSYGDISIDTDDNIFLSIDEYGKGRATALWQEGEEDEDGYWDFSFPEKVEERLEGRE